MIEWTIYTIIGEKFLNSELLTIIEDEKLLFAINLKKLVLVVDIR